MNENEKQNTIKQSVMDAIQTEQVKMKPRIFFVAITAILGISIGALFAVTISIISVILTELRVMATLEALTHTNIRWQTFLTIIPWFSIGLLMLVFALLIYAIRKYHVAYRTSLTSMLFMLLFAIATSGIIADRTGLGESLDDLPPFKQFHPMTLSQRFNKQAWIAGSIQDIETDHFVIIDPQRKLVNVYFIDAEIEPEYETVEVNKFIHGYGVWENEDFYATELIITKHAPRFNGIFSPKGNVNGLQLRRGMME